MVRAAMELQVAMADSQDSEVSQATEVNQDSVANQDSEEEWEVNTPTGTPTGPATK